MIDGFFQFVYFGGKQTEWVISMLSGRGQGCGVTAAWAPFDTRGNLDPRPFSVSLSRARRADGGALPHPNRCVMMTSMTQDRRPSSDFLITKSNSQRKSTEI